LGSGSTRAARMSASATEQCEKLDIAVGVFTEAAES
jgi:hypothetical protein